MGVRKIKNNINFSFFILIFWFIFSNNLQGFFVFLITLFIHEFGHYFVAKKRGYRLAKCSISVYGICLDYDEKFFHPKDEVLIAIAGPATNFLFAICCVCLWWIFPDFYNFSHLLVKQSMCLGLFNLLPCYPMDGGRVFVGFFSEILTRKKAIKITFLFNIFIAVIFFILFVISCFINFNPTFCICGVFMIISSLENRKECYYQQINIFNKKLKNYSKPSIQVVSEKEEIVQLIKRVEINKFTVFLVVFDGSQTFLLDEKKLQHLAIKFPLTTSIGQALKQEKA